MSESNAEIQRQLQAANLRLFAKREEMARRDALELPEHISVVMARVFAEMELEAAMGFGGDDA